MKKKTIWALVPLLFVAGGLVAFNHQQKTPKKDTLTTETSVNTEISSDPVASRSTYTQKMVYIDIDPSQYQEGEDIYIQLKSEANAESGDLEELYRGEWGTYVAESGDWVQLTSGTGHTGWIPKSNGKISEITRRSPTDQLSQMTIVLDAGHGGEDTGAEQYEGSELNEKTLTLKTALAVGKKLQALGTKVVYTREKDELLSLDQVNQIANQSGGDLFLSFHYDSYDWDNGNSGTSTYYYYEYEKPLAEAINQALTTDLPLPNNGIRFGNYAVIRENVLPGLLLELGYMNSDQDVAQISQPDYPDKVAEAIVKALAQYVESSSSH